MSTRGTKGEVRKTTSSISVESPSTVTRNSEKSTYKWDTHEVIILFENLSVIEKKWQRPCGISTCFGDSRDLNSKETVAEDEDRVSLLRAPKTNALDIGKEFGVRKEETVLTDTTGAIFGGRVTGIVSICGSKSSSALLEVLSAKHNSHQTGSIWANGIPSLHKDFSEGVAFIDSGTTGFEDLTVKQNLLFSVAIRTSKNACVNPKVSHFSNLDSYGRGSCSRASAATSFAFTGDRRDAVCKTMEILELEKHKNTILRKATPFTRKRVFIAQEFLMNPFLLIIEDIVQGLATYQVQMLLNMLQKLLRDPIDGIFLPTKPAIVVGLVHPRWTIMRLLDDVIMMERETVAFIGTPSQLLAEARELHPMRRLVCNSITHERGQKDLTSSLTRSSDVPYQTENVMVPSLNPSRDTSMIRTSTSVNRTSIDKVSPEALINNIYRIAIDSNLGTIKDALKVKGELEKIKKLVGAKLMAFASGQVDPMRRQEEEAMVIYRRPPSPNSAVKLFYLIYASFCELRNDFVTPLLFIIAVISIAVSVASTLHMQYGQDGMQNRLGIIFFILAGTFMQTLLTVDRQRRNINSFRRQRLHGYFGPFTFMIHWIFTTALLRVFISGIFIAIIYIVSQIYKSFNSGQFTWLILIIAFTSFSLTSLVACVSAIAPNTRSTVVVLLIIYLMNIVSAGLLINMRTLPKPIQYMTYASHLHLSYEAAVVTMFEGENFNCSSGLINVTYSVSVSPLSLAVRHDDITSGNTTPSGHDKYIPQACFTGDHYLYLLDFQYNSKQLNLIPLGIMTAVSLIGFYLALQICRKPRGISEMDTV